MPTSTYILTISTTLALVFQLFATISTPLTSNVYLSHFNGYRFGVFGWCNTENGNCTSVKLGYSSKDAFLFAGQDELALPTQAKYSLSKLLVVHPIALCSTAILWVMVIFVQFCDDTDRSLTAIIIWSFLTYLQTLLCFLVDVLLFIPYLDWPGWLILVSAILIVFSSSVSCLRRRTISSWRYERTAKGEDIELYPLHESYHTHKDSPLVLERHGTNSDLSTKNTLPTNRQQNSRNAILEQP
ncbi:Rim9p Ecym_3418 [Eremothecium cymbalariae DBVPG|uniref:PH-response regulator protein palI/RIM9 n=1 Tax=Eremothecium cymbalariae (strain CBS 270.75 / DBVPG 7215 / KCTC 17166 / NRRL Y-17582) TaxID=931890 RepID=G8JRY5_ERECY|nr:Hypothetical protein Ecym_3418 [Eremothecium cymbalariae DBVPG\